MTVNDLDALLNFIEIELNLHRELLVEFAKKNDEARMLAANACIYELELLQAYAKHLPRVSGDD